MKDQTEKCEKKVWASMSLFVMIWCYNLHQFPLYRKQTRSEPPWASLWLCRHPATDDDAWWAWSGSTSPKHRGRPLPVLQGNPHASRWLHRSPRRFAEHVRVPSQCMRVYNVRCKCRKKATYSLTHVVCLCNGWQLASYLQEPSEHGLLQQQLQAPWQP